MAPCIDTVTQQFFKLHVGKVSVKGSVIAQPLLQINSAEEVKNLAQRMVDCWTEKFGEV